MEQWIQPIRNTNSLPGESSVSLEEVSLNTHVEFSDTSLESERGTFEDYGKGPDNELDNMESSEEYSSSEEEPSSYDYEVLDLSIHRRNVLVDNSIREKPALDLQVEEKSNERGATVEPGSTGGGTPRNKELSASNNHCPSSSPLPYAADQMERTDLVIPPTDCSANIFAAWNSSFGSDKNSPPPYIDFQVLEYQFAGCVFFILLLLFCLLTAENDI